MPKWLKFPTSFPLSCFLSCAFSFRFVIPCACCLLHQRKFNSISKSAGISDFVQPVQPLNLGPQIYGDANCFFSSHVLGKFSRARSCCYWANYKQVYILGDCEKGWCVCLELLDSRNHTKTPRLLPGWNYAVKDFCPPCTAREAVVCGSSGCGSAVHSQ